MSISIIKKTLLATVLAALLAPSMASARPAKGYAKTVRRAISSMTGVKASQIRYRSKVDKAHGADGHQHIVGHEPRNVFFRAGRATGKAKTDTTPIGGPTRVTEIYLNPIAPNH